MHWKKNMTNFQNIFFYQNVENILVYSLAYFHQIMRDSMYRMPNWTATKLSSFQKKKTRSPARAWKIFVRRDLIKIFNKKFLPRTRWFRLNARKLIRTALAMKNILLDVLSIMSRSPGTPIRFKHWIYTLFYCL